jgi:O-antigen/teichoic acid export membrane protein
LLAAHRLASDDFGAFAFSFALYVCVLGVSRGFVSHTVAVKNSADDRDDIRRAIESSVAAVLAVGAVTGTLVALAAVTLGGDLRGSLLALGATLPLLLLQDALRLAFIVASRPKSAALNDALWTVMALVGGGLLVVSGIRSPAGYVLTWGATAGIAAGAALREHSLRPRCRGGIEWLWEQRRFGLAFAFEFLASSGPIQAAPMIVGAAAGLSGAGGFRAGQLLFGPVNLALVGLRLSLVPEVVRLVKAGRAPAATRLLATTSAGCALTALATAGLMLIDPLSIGPRLLGGSWPAAQATLVPMASVYIATSVLLPAQVGLRGLGAIGRTVPRHFLSALPAVVLLVVGASLDGARGAAAGLAGATVIVIPLWYVRFSLGSSEPTDSPAAAVA